MAADVEERLSEALTTLSSSARAAASFSRRVASMPLCRTRRLSRRCSLVSSTGESADKREGEGALPGGGGEGGEGGGAVVRAVGGKGEYSIVTGSCRLDEDEEDSEVGGKREKKGGAEKEGGATTLSSPAPLGGCASMVCCASGAGVVDAAVDGSAADDVTWLSATGMLMTHWSAVLREASVTVWKRSGDSPGKDGHGGDEEVSESDELLRLIPHHHHVESRAAVCRPSGLSVCSPSSSSSTSAGLKQQVDVYGVGLADRAARSCIEQ